MRDLRKVADEFLLSRPLVVTVEPLAATAAGFAVQSAHSIPAEADALAALLRREVAAAYRDAAVLCIRDARHGWVGCGDNSCEISKPSGMATNGGCRCRADVRLNAYRSALRARAEDVSRGS